MALDALAGELDYPMIIVTTTSRSGERAGCLVGFHTQCSIDPLRWAVLLSVKNHTYRVALDAASLAVHFPSSHDRDLAELFGSTTGDEIDKFAQCEWTEGRDGVPLLSRCPNRFVGRILTVEERTGDHSCFIIEPVESEHVSPVDQLTFQSVRDLNPGHDA